MTQWGTRKQEKISRKLSVKDITDNKVIPTKDIVKVLGLLIKSNDCVALEGDNQKQATFLAKALNQLNPKEINGLHMVISSMSLPEHLEIFEKGIAKKLDFAYAGPQSKKIVELIEQKKIEINAINTYLELYSKLFVDISLNVCLIAADKADRNGNLYTGPNTEETPTIVEATAFKGGIVIAQVNEIVDELPRIDIQSEWVDYIVEADEPYYLEPLFTKDPQHITEVQILMAMMTIKGIYQKHNLQSLNHGVGFNTAAIELLLPTYGESLGLKGKICSKWVLNPHPTLIPAIESGWVDNICAFGGEVGMEEYVKERSDIFFTGVDGALRSNRTYAQMAGLYAADAFVGATLQMDKYGNSSTVTKGRLTGFGGAPNMGHNPGGRRHSTDTWVDLKQDDNYLTPGRKIVIQMLETYKSGNKPIIVDQLDAVEVGKEANLAVAPVMIFGEDVTHLVTEEGIAYLYKTKTPEERKEAIAAVAGVTNLGKTATKESIIRLRKQGIIAYPEDLGIKRSDAKRSLLAAKNMNDLVDWSKGLYNPPAKFMK
ncbi:malonate decarboxylase subunit alpha [Intestinibacter sp.]